jgi:hypothetical protein
MTNTTRYTAAINRLTVRAAQLDYDRYLNRISENKYNRRINRVYAKINQLHDLLKYMPVLIATYGENEILRSDIKALI